MQTCMHSLQVRDESFSVLSFLGMPILTNFHECRKFTNDRDRHPSLGHARYHRPCRLPVHTRAAGG